MAEVADGAGGYTGATNWNALDVEAIWRTLAGQRTEAQWAQVTGWRKTYELGIAHLGRLLTYRTGLAEAWPPEKNAASRTYLAQLDRLTDSIRQTCDAASANYTTLAAATSALDTSRAQVKKIYDEYQDKIKTKAEYDKQVAAMTEAGFTNAWKPPVTDVELARLNTRARTVMFSLSGELTQAQTQIRQPPRYDVLSIGDQNQPDVYGASSPPSIPPIVPAPTGAASPSLASSRAASLNSGASPVGPDSGPTDGGAGPILGSAGTIKPSALPLPAPGPLAPPPGPAGGGVAVALPPGVPIPPGGFGRVTGNLSGPGAVTEGGARLLRPGVGEVGGPARAMPPGGLIGAGPGAGRPNAGATPTRRINPVGGVIGGGAAGTAPAGRAGQRPVTAPGRPPLGAQLTGGQQLGAPAGGRRDGEENGQRWDLDNPWEVEEGVAPVVLPPDDPGRIDPGPAIGFER